MDPSLPVVVPCYGWTINSWACNSGIPVNGVQQGGPVKFWLDPNTDSYALQWLDQSGNLCQVPGLQPDPTKTILQGKGLSVSFGTNNNFTCDVTVTLSFTCSIAESVVDTGSSGGRVLPETGSGTFTATATGG